MRFVVVVLEVNGGHISIVLDVKKDPKRDWRLNQNIDRVS